VFERGNIIMIPTNDSIKKYSSPFMFSVISTTIEWNFGENISATYCYCR